MTAARFRPTWQPGRYRILEVGVAVALLALGILNRHMSPEGNGWSTGSVLAFIPLVALVPFVRSWPAPR